MGQICSGQKGEQSKGSALSGDVTADDLAILEAERLAQKQPQTLSVAHHSQQASSSSLTALQQQATGSTANAAGIQSGTTSAVQSAEEKERIKAQLLEQQRLDVIVSTAGRGMVAVRSTRGSTGYYDQGFAAALAQHLEQTTSFPERLPVRLPPFAHWLSAVKGGDAITQIGTSGDKSGKSAMHQPESTQTEPDSKASSSNSLYERLAQPPWEGIVLGTAGTETTASSSGTTANSNGLAGCAPGENPHRYFDNVAESLLDTTLPGKQHLFAGVKPMVENLV